MHKIVDLMVDLTVHFMVNFIIDLMDAFACLTVHDALDGST